jgi:mycothiol S-conjugate amidase
MLHDAAAEEGIESPYAGWLDHWDEMGFEDPEITTQVDVADYIELRSKALLAHATQIDPDSFWFAVPDEIQKKVYPWEDYTLVETTTEREVPEDDLFANVQ